MPQGSYFDRQEKSYTLTIIADPEEAGLEKTFADYKKWLLSSSSGYSKPKRLVVNANQKQGGKSMVLSQQEDERMRKNTQTIGKVVFMKERDIEMNAFEREISKWASEFHKRLGQLCSQKPRFSEMRPAKFNL